MDIPVLSINNKKLSFPIIQGGMGIRISLGGLAKACMKNGIASTISMAQIGFLKKGFKKNPIQSNMEAMKEEIESIRSSDSSGVLGVNLMHAMNHYEEYARFLSRQKIDFIISGAGLPLDLPKYVKDSSVKAAFIVSSARACKILLKSWDKKHSYMPAFIVCEGPLAGGHLGFSVEDIENGTVATLEEIVLEVKKLVSVFEEKYKQKIPIIAAGGIHSGKDIARFLSLGCDGVQMATTFIATSECDASVEYKDMIVKAKKEDILRISSPAGLPARAVRNALTDSLEKGNIETQYCVDCLKSCKKTDIPYCITQQLGNSAAGDPNGLIFTGAKGYLIEKIQSVEELVKSLINECKKEYVFTGGTV